VGHPPPSLLQYRRSPRLRHPLRAEETVAIAALIQATAAYLYKLHESNQDFRQYARPLLMENKFRAVRYGLDGSLIDFGKQQEVPSATSSRISRPRRSRRRRTRQPRSHQRRPQNPLDRHRCDRQLKVFEDSNHDLKAVVDYMAQETRAGL